MREKDREVKKKEKEREVKKKEKEKETKWDKIINEEEKGREGERYKNYKNEIGKW